MRIDLSKIEPDIVHFVAEKSAEECFRLGQMYALFDTSTWGYSVNMELTVGVSMKELIDRSIQKKTISED